MSQGAQRRGVWTHRERKREQTRPGAPAWETWLQMTQELLAGLTASGWSEVTSKHSVKRHCEHG